ncbi:hypothetical protein DSM112329_04136 [Paraconexibacter sp. AEG42_29]|uniref:Uncharacterized protein n=1 Tax=Paraconexibacter sp. AEG42_29 TaxID=2997339 RepID=A0AAU7AZU9_9ACTN
MHTIDTAAPATPVLAISRGTDRSITLHALGLQGPESVGTFASARDAWAAVDALDLPDELAA